MFYEKVAMLCYKNGISMTALVDKLGISTSVVTSWKKQGATPRPSNVKKIAEYFNVPVSYFFEGEADDRAISKEADKKRELSPKEEQLLEMVKNLSDNEVDMLTVFITTLLNARK